MGFNFQPPFTPRQQKAIALVPKFFASPSIVGSIFIVQHVLRNPKRRQGVYHRILLLMSVHDFIYSVKAFMSTWPMPKDTPFVYGASGNTGTCTAAGFWGQGGALTSICYNGSLTLYFLLVVRYGWKEEYIKRKIEVWLHLIPIAIGWSTAIAGLPLLLYNPFGWTCWINTFPIFCQDNVTCERGNNAGIYRWAFFHAQLWACFGFCFFAMGSVYHRILQQEQRMKRYDFRRSQNIVEGGGNAIVSSSSLRNKRTSHTKSAKFALQATFYVIVFFFTWFFPMLQAILSFSSGALYYPLIMLSAMLSSLQGFSNALIYLRPRYLRIRENNPEEKLCVIISLVLGSDDSGVRRRNDPSIHSNVAAWRQSSNSPNPHASNYDAVRSSRDPSSTEQSVPLSNEHSGQLQMEEKKMGNGNSKKPPVDEDDNVEEDQYME